MKYVSKFIDVGKYRVFKIDDDGMGYRYEADEWIPLGHEIDYWSGFGDSYLYDIISEEDAKELLGVDEL